MVDTLEYYWHDISSRRAEAVLREEELPGRYLLRQESGDILVSFLDPELKVKHFYVNQRSDSLLYKARPELKNSLLETFQFMKEASSLQWLYPVNIDDHNHDQDPDSGEGDQDVPDPGACRVCGILDPSSHHNRLHRLVFCDNCDSMVARSVWTQHKCNQRYHQCPVCTYKTVIPSNLRRHIKAKHPVNDMDVGEVGGQGQDEQQQAEDDTPAAAKSSQEPPQSSRSSRSRVSLLWLWSLLMTGLMIFVTGYSGTAGLLSLATEKEKPSQDEDWEWLENPKRGRGRPRCPPGWLTCNMCGYHAPSKKRLRTHERKHDRELKKLNQFFECKYQENGCQRKSRKKYNIQQHEIKCSHKPKSPKTLSADTLWDIISLFPLSNSMAYKFLRMLEKALDFRFLPTGLKEEMKTRLNCCMQFLTSELVQFKVRIFDK